MGYHVVIMKELFWPKFARVLVRYPPLRDLLPLNGNSDSATWIAVSR